MDKIKSNKPSRVRSYIAALMDKLFSEQRTSQIQEMLAESSKHMPSAEFASYRDEMIARHEYIKGAMQRDMREVLKKEFPQTHEEIEETQVNLKIFRSKIKEKAKVFCEGTQFKLIKADGSEADDKHAARWSDLLDQSGILRGLKHVDILTRGMHRCMPSLGGITTQDTCD